jgi:hypothetical protein
MIAFVRTYLTAEMLHVKPYDKNKDKIYFECNKNRSFLLPLPKKAGLKLADIWQTADFTARWVKTASFPNLTTPH